MDKKKAVYNATENTKRRLKVEYITHDRTGTRSCEEMVVIEAPKDAANERVAEVRRPVKGGNATGEVLPNTEVSGAPSDFLPERHEAAGDSGNGALACASRGLHVKIDAAGQVEDTLNRSVYFGAEFDHGHSVAEA